MEIDPHIDIPAPAASPARMFVIWHYVIRWGLLGFWLLLAASALLGRWQFVHVILRYFPYFFIPLGACGAIMALLWMTGKLRFACPQCQGKNTSLHKSHGNGLALFCSECGLTEEAGLFKLRLKHSTLAELELQQREDEDEDEDEEEVIDADTARKNIGGHYER